MKRSPSGTCPKCVVARHSVCLRDLGMFQVSFYNTDQKARSSPFVACGVRESRRQVTSRTIFVGRRLGPDPTKKPWFDLGPSCKAGPADWSPRQTLQSEGSLG